MVYLGSSTASNLILYITTKLFSCLCKISIDFHILRRIAKEILLTLYTPLSLFLVGSASIEQFEKPTDTISSPLFHNIENLVILSQNRQQHTTLTDERRTVNKKHWPVTEILLMLKGLKGTFACKYSQNLKPMFHQLLTMHW